MTGRIRCLLYVNKCSGGLTIGNEHEWKEATTAKRHEGSNEDENLVSEVRVPEESNSRDIFLFGFAFVFSFLLYFIDVC